jgi:F-box protein 21
VDWKRLFILRRNQNTRISHLFEEILTTKLRRWRKFEEICALGYDARDFIWEQCNVEADAEDVLARRYG